MLGWKYEQGNLWNTVVVEHWNYEAGDWVVELGLPDHHLRIVRQFFDASAVRWYRIFDTSLRGGYGDYGWRQADELESKSRLKARPEPDQVPAILERTERCRFVEWSILARTECESIQGWIHTGNESDRWSSQVWMALPFSVQSLLRVPNRGSAGLDIASRTNRFPGGGLRFPFPNPKGT